MLSYASKENELSLAEIYNQKFEQTEVKGTFQKSRKIKTAKRMIITRFCFVFLLTMSLITDPLYLIHISRVKFLRMDERGERIITFPPTVMSDDYVRLAAPVYPEMQYCYSPVYDNYMNDSGGFNNGLTSSPRTTKRNYRHRKQLPSNANTRYNQQYVAPNANAGASTVITHQKQQQRQQRLSSSRLQEATTDSEEEDVEVEDNLR
jgi:hypothetical protein